MFGCLRRIGCLVILLLLIGGAYYWWTMRVSPSSPPASASGIWHPVTGSDAAAGARSVESLRATQGKVFANLTAAQAVAYLIQQSAKQLPPSATDVQAMITGDELHVRAVLPLRDLGGTQVLGPLAAMLGSRDTVQLAGRVDLVRPGLAQMHVTSVRIQTLNVPAAMIPKIVQQIRHESPAGLASDAIAIPLPPYIGDVRIADGKVTLYKNVQ